SSGVVTTRRWRAGSLALVDFAPLDQRYGTEELGNRNHHPDDQAGKGGREYDRSENRHWSVAGKRVGVANIVRRVMNRADMREADHADNEKAERHRQHSLRNNVGVDGGSGQMGGLGLLHVYPRRIRSF